MKIEASLIHFCCYYIFNSVEEKLWTILYTSPCSYVNLPYGPIVKLHLICATPLYERSVLISCTNHVFQWHEQNEGLRPRIYLLWIFTPIKGDHPTANQFISTVSLSFTLASFSYTLISLTKWLTTVSKKMSSAIMKSYFFLQKRPVNKPPFCFQSLISLFILLYCTSSTVV